MPQWHYFHKARLVRPQTTGLAALADPAEHLGREPIMVASRSAGTDCRHLWCDESRERPGHPETCIGCYHPRRSPGRYPAACRCLCPHLRAVGSPAGKLRRSNAMRRRTKAPSLPKIVKASGQPAHSHPKSPGIFAVGLAAISLSAIPPPCWQNHITDRRW